MSESHQMITKLKIAICEDETSQREYLAQILRSWAKKRHYLLEWKEYAEAQAFLFDYEEEKDYDILLLDVEMPGMTGIDIARKVRENDSAVQIIFVTGYYEYFSEGFDVSALHYLIKPIDASRLCPVLERAVSNLQYRSRSVLVTAAEGDIKVPLAEILYIKAENVYVVVCTRKGSYRMRTTLGKFAEQLDDTFYKVHRSYIVGLKYVKMITRSEVTLINGEEIPISRGNYDEIHGALIKYL